MDCLKCGTKIEDSQVFCKGCLADMKRYPVKPELRIQLLTRPAPEAAKKQPSRKRAPSAEETLVRLRSIIKWLTILLITLLLLFVFSLSLLLKDSTSENPQENIGQNYNTIGAESRTR